jgi:galactose mutarotase-like enzyme
MERIDYHGRELLRWSAGPSTFLALPEAGARLMNWHVTLGDGSVRDVLHWPEGASVEDIARVRGGNPILFPFCARSYDGGELGWWSWEGVRRPMPMHGFARQGRFQLTRADAGGFAAQFVPSDEARASYPFDYEFTVDYRFEPVGFFVELALRNLGTVPLPWSAGHHFYFTVPWSEGRTRADYTLRLAAREAWRHQLDGSLAPQPAPPTQALLTQPEWVDRIHTALREPTVILAERGTGARLTLSLANEGNPAPDTAVVTWTESDHAPFYCIEPWMGPPNSPGHRRGLHLVDPGRTQRFVVEVRIA